VIAAVAAQDPDLRLELDVVIQTGRRRRGFRGKFGRRRRHQRRHHGGLAFHYSCPVPASTHCLNSYTSPYAQFSYHSQSINQSISVFINSGQHTRIQASLLLKERMVRYNWQLTSSLHITTHTNLLNRHLSNKITNFKRILHTVLFFWIRKRVPKRYQRCSSWSSCCYQIFKVLRLCRF